MKISKIESSNETLKYGSVEVYANSLITDCEFDEFIRIGKNNFIDNSKLGKLTYSGNNTVIRSAEIGKFCSIAWNVTIGGKNHDYKMASTHSIRNFYKQIGKPLKSKYYYGEDYGECKIGNDVWIGAGVIVLRNVIIGDGAVVGAGAVVTKNVEPYSINVGVPAKKISYRFDDSIIKKLLKIKWWDWPIETIEKHIELIYSTKIDSSTIDRLSEINRNIKREIIK